MTPETIDPTELALLREVCTHPADLGPRLDFADWLDAQDRDVEAAVVRTPGLRWLEAAIFRPDVRAAGRRRMALGLPRATQYAATTAAVINGRPESVHPYSPVLTVNHGMVEQIACMVEFWFKHGPRLVTVQPIRAVRFNLVRPDAGRDGEFVLNFGPGVGESYIGGWLYDNLPRTRVVREAVFPGRRKRAALVFYAAERDALAEVSAAAVKWARTQAGLPPLGSADGEQ